MEYPEGFTSALIEFFEKEKVKTIYDEELLLKIESSFDLLFGGVSAVQAQYSESNGYYYVVFGSKEGASKIDLLEVTGDDVINNTYSYINFDSIDNSTVTGYCRKGPDFGMPVAGVCGDCAPYPAGGCLGKVCGVIAGGTYVSE